MIWYLARKYIALVLVLAVLMALLPTVTGIGTSLRQTVVQAFFWSGLAAAPLTYWEFRRRNLWPLYDNLRLPRWALLALFVASVESLILVASLVFG